MVVGLQDAPKPIKIHKYKSNNHSEEAGDPRVHLKWQTQGHPLGQRLGLHDLK